MKRYKTDHFDWCPSCKQKLHHAQLVAEYSVSYDYYKCVRCNADVYVRNVASIASKIHEYLASLV